MVEIILALVLIGLATWIIDVSKFYSKLGKNQDFSEGTKPAAKRALHYIATHKPEVSAILWLVILILPAVASLLIFVRLGFWGAIAVYLLLVWLFAVMPQTKTLIGTTRLAYWLAPPLRNISERLHPYYNKTKSLRKRVVSQSSDSGIYTPDDLTHLLRAQKHADNNNISDTELDNLIARLEFEHKQVREAMLPFSELRIVGASEQIGPVLISELHETDQKYFLVEEEFNQDIIGYIGVSELADLKKTGDVKSVMNPKLYYLNQDSGLKESLSAYLQTGSPVYAVVNSRQTIVGILSIENVLKDLANIGQLGDFNMYDSSEAVAQGRQWDDEQEADQQ